MARYLPSNFDTTVATKQLSNVVADLAKVLARLKPEGKQYTHNPMRDRGEFDICLIGEAVTQTLQTPTQLPSVFDVTFKSHESVKYVRKHVMKGLPNLRILKESDATLVVVHDTLSNRIYRLRIDNPQNELSIIETLPFYHERITFNSMFGLSIGNDDEAIYEAIANKVLRLDSDMLIPPLTTLNRALNYIEAGYTFHKPSVNTLLTSLHTTTEDLNTGKVTGVRLSDPPNSLLPSYLSDAVNRLERRKLMYADVLDDGIESYPVVGIDGRLKENYLS